MGPRVVVIGVVVVDAHGGLLYGRHARDAEEVVLVPGGARLVRGRFGGQGIGIGIDMGIGIGIGIVGLVDGAVVRAGAPSLGGTMVWTLRSDGATDSAGSAPMGGVMGGATGDDSTSTGTAGATGETSTGSGSTNAVAGTGVKGGGAAAGRDPGPAAGGGSSIGTDTGADTGVGGAAAGAMGLTSMALRPTPASTVTTAGSAPVPGRC